MGEAKTIGENEDVVRIMTVHKSKGLEFPVVILAGAGRTICFRGSGSSMEMHKDCGIGLPLVNREEGWHKKTLLQRVIEGKKAAEELEEEVRILYVALTRAIDRLEIVGSVKDLDSLDEEQAGKRSFLDMVYAPLKQMCIRDRHPADWCEHHHIMSLPVAGSYCVQCIGRDVVVWCACTAEDVYKRQVGTCAGESGAGIYVSIV